MWNKKPISSPSSRLAFAGFLLVGLLALEPKSHSHLPSQEPSPLPGEHSLHAPIPALASPATILIAASSTTEYAKVNSDFYLTRTNGFDRTLSLGLAIVAASGEQARQITMFVTFLPGEKERLVIVQPIIEHLFAPGQEVYVRILPVASRSTHTAAAASTNPKGLQISREQ